MAKDNEPKLDRGMQDRIGHELRAMYEELLKQPLPEKLTAPLQALQEPRSPQEELKEAVAGMRQPTPKDAEKRQTRERAWCQLK